MQYKKILPLLGILISSSVLSACNNATPDLYGPAPNVEEKDADTPVNVMYGVKTESYDWEEPQEDLYGPDVTEYEWEDDNTTSTSESMSEGSDILGAQKDNIKSTIFKTPKERRAENMPFYEDEDFVIVNLYGVKPNSGKIENLKDKLSDKDDLKKDKVVRSEKELSPLLYGPPPVQNSLDVIIKD